MLVYGAHIFNRMQLDSQVKEVVGAQALQNAEKNKVFAKSFVDGLSRKDLENYGFGDQKIPLTEAKQIDSKSKPNTTAQKRKQAPEPVEEEQLPVATGKNKKQKANNKNDKSNELVQLPKDDKKSVAFALGNNQTKEFSRKDDDMPVAKPSAAKQDSPKQQQQQQQKQDNKKQQQEQPQQKQNNKKQQQEQQPPQNNKKQQQPKPVEQPAPQQNNKKNKKQKQ
eukprot:UN00115